MKLLLSAFGLPFYRAFHFGFSLSQNNLAFGLKLSAFGFSTKFP